MSENWKMTNEEKILMYKNNPELFEKMLKKEHELDNWLAPVVDKTIYGLYVMLGLAVVYLLLTLVQLFCAIAVK